MGLLLSGTCPELTGLTSSLTTTLSATATRQGPSPEAPARFEGQNPDPSLCVPPQLLRSWARQHMPWGRGSLQWAELQDSWVEMQEGRALSSVTVAWEGLTGSQGHFLPRH